MCWYVGMSVSTKQRSDSSNVFHAVHDFLLYMNACSLLCVHVGGASAHLTGTVLRFYYNRQLEFSSWRLQKYKNARPVLHVCRDQELKHLPKKAELNSAMDRVRIPICYHGIIQSIPVPRQSSLSAHFKFYRPR